MNVTDELNRSVVTGRWGFQTVITPAPQGVVQTDTLISVEVPSAIARTWTVHLNAWRYSGGPVPDPTQPAENQLAGTQSHIRARVVFGVEAASETALVDYPVRGCSFPVTAGSLRVSLLSEGPVTVTLLGTPTLSGFASPGARGCILPGAAPTFTPDRQSLVVPASPVVFAVPSRAVGYRLFFPGPLPIGATVRMDQIVADQTVIVSSDTVIPTGGGSGNEQDASNRAAYTPIYPSTSFVRATMVGAGAVTPVAVSFVLDLG